MITNPTLKDIDFSKLRFPIHTVEHGTDLLHKFPQLAEYDEFSDYGQADRNKVIRYIIYMYDTGNREFVEKFPDLRKRKEAALDMAGFERGKTTGKFKTEILRMVNLEKSLVKEDPTDEESKMVVESNKIFDMAMRYIKEQNNRIWSMIISNEQVFDEYQRIIMEPVSDKKDKDLMSAATAKDDLMEICEKINLRLDGYYKQLFGSDEDLKEKIKVQRITPETIHKTLN